MKKNTKKLLIGLGVAAGTVAGLAITNQFITGVATKNDYLNFKNGNYYNYRLGKIFYRKSGKGSPIVLIHNPLDGYGCSYEFIRLEKKLAVNHTVYSVDLIGYGKSDKPKMIYTNFIYAHMINSFLTDVVKKKAHVVTSGFSSNFIIMACVLNESLYSEISMINPASLDTGKNVSFINRVGYHINTLPILGTFLYNIRHSRLHLTRKIKKTWFTNEESVRTYDIKALYKASHLKGYNNTYVAASVDSNFININVTDALSKIKDVKIHVLSSDVEVNSIYTMNEFVHVQPKVSQDYLDHAGALVALEYPEDITKYIQ